MKKDKNNEIALFVKEKRKQYGISQVEFAFKTGLGLRFIRELEQGKLTVRMDKVNQVLEMFGYTVSLKKIDKKEIENE